MCEQSYDNYLPKHKQLLLNLKSTVEGLLVGQVRNVWFVYGGLNRLHNAMEKIFMHGCKSVTEGIPDYWNFVQGLAWLQPSSTLMLDSDYKPHVPQHMKHNKASIWLFTSLESHSLSQKLSWLLSERNHLTACYQPQAFLNHPEYIDSALICLRAVERNQPSLISEINPGLFLNKDEQVQHKTHRRCSSFPNSQFKNERKISYTSSVREVLRSWSSMPNLVQKKATTFKCCSHTVPSTPIHVRYSQTKPVRKSKVFKRSNKVKHVIINNCDIVEHTPHISSSLDTTSALPDLSNLSFKSLPEMHCRTLNAPVDSQYSLLRTFSGEKDYKRQPKKTFIEDGGMSVLPMSTGYFPKPSKGQSLTEFLTSSQFSRTNAELDRENAHFRISEAIISAVEYMRWRRDENLDESDEEIRDLKQRIRLRRRQKMKEKIIDFYSLGVNAYASFLDTHTDGSVSSEEVDDLDIDEACNLSDKRGISMSMASLYSDADIFKKPREAPDGASDILSAEGVALSLISKFNEKKLPRASDLEWLVSEEDAPQALLPIPKSFPISPDDSEDSPHTSLRGTQEWAPPRPQIIFTPHPRPNRKDLMENQSYRCAGCGMRVATQYASKFRYCNYLGRYFCTGCHTNQLSFIPGCILQKWDFTRYPVSNFSYRLLEQMYPDPLFCVIELNHQLMKVSKNLEMCRKYRNGLFYMKDFISTCRFAETVKECLDYEKVHIMMEPEIYSMQDLVNVRNGEMKSRLKLLVEMCCRHTSECELCRARGFICEICMSETVIFPWQFRSVTRCYKCGTCFHTTCWNKTMDGQCIRCKRITKRHEDADRTVHHDTPALVV